MSNVVVYVFLLDNLVGGKGADEPPDGKRLPPPKAICNTIGVTGFRSALNETVVRNTPSSYKNFTPVVRQCDTSTTNQILNAVTKELDMEIMPAMKTSTINVDKFAKSLSEAFNDASQDALYNVLLESSMPVVDGKDESKEASIENDSAQKYRRTFENVHNIKKILEEDGGNENKGNVTEDNKKIEVAKDHAEEDEHKHYVNNLVQEEEHHYGNAHNITNDNANTKNINNFTDEVSNTQSSEAGFPSSAPFLVAIFETLSNITAQTCAGTLIAPNWVLTGANCVNILSNLYANDTSIADSQTLYTVVAGAIDPLSDGSAHNVTAVLQHEGFSENSTRNRKSIHVEVGPYLAMMQIEPAFEGVGLSLIEERIKKGDVMIYGWILTKGESGLDTLNLVIISALILSTAECQAMYSFNNNDVICLFNNDNETNITQLSSGGPVLMIHGGEPKLLAVAQTDEHVFIAYPLYVHYNWIKSILNSNI